MGRAAVLGHVLFAIALVCSSVPAQTTGSPDRPRRTFTTRVIKIGGALGSPVVRDHIRFSTSIGYNAIWVPSASAALWTPLDAPDGPELRPEFIEFARSWAERDVRVVLVIQPLTDHGEGFVLSDKRIGARLERLMRIARREAGIHDFVLSFFGSPLRLSDLSDRLEFGPTAASAHVALARRLTRKLARGDRLWLEPAVTSDRYLADPDLPYATSLLAALDGLDLRVGIVWSGPQPISPSLTVEDVLAARSRFGDRPLLFDDRYPANGSGRRIPLALVLGPLRDREPAVADHIDTYVTTPMTELGASRLALLTIAEFLRDPDGYDADASWSRARKRLTGDDAAAREALRTQAAEWGGWIETRNYHTAADANPRTAAASLDDPAAFSAWIWPVRTYPGRMAKLAALDDERFRNELLLTMGRRLAVARTVPLVKRILEPGTPEEEVAGLRRSIEDERRKLTGKPDVLLALDRFLLHAGLSSLLSPGDPPPEATP